MKIEWFVARRYLFSRERNALISVNTLISVMGVAVGVAALVVVIGVMDGASKLMMHQITSVAPHLRLVPEDPGQQPLDAPLLASLHARPGVLRADPIYEKTAFIQLPRGSQAQKQGIQLHALDTVGPEGAFTFNFPPGFTSFTLQNDQIVLGVPLAQKLGATTGSLVQLLYQPPRSTASSQIITAHAFRVAALVSAGYYEFDSASAFINTGELLKLFPQNGPDYISIKLRDPEQAPALKLALDSTEGYSVRTWEMEFGGFFASLKIQKYGLFIILLLIILVSALNIIGTLILMVTEKTREIGILCAMGASRGFIGRLFLFIGIIIGLAGTGLGLALGVVIALLVPYAPLNMPEAIYNFNRLPMEIRPATLGCIAAAAFVICTFGALIPAWQASRLKPAEAVRYD